MSPLFAPVLAQLITLGVTDRTEASHLAVNVSPRYEASTTPHAYLTFEWPHTSLSVGYGASLTLTPLESKPRDFLVYQDASASAAYDLRHTSFTLSSSINWGEVNFVTQPLLGPQVPLPGAGDTPGNEPDGPDQPPTQPSMPGAGDPQGPGQGIPPEQLQKDVYDEVVRYFTWSSTFRVQHQLSKQVVVGAFSSYLMDGALDVAAQKTYPLTRGWAIGTDMTYTFVASGRDSFDSNVSLQQTWSSNGNRATALLGNEIWHHAFDEHTTGSLGVGVSMVRNSQPNGLIAYSVYPNFLAGITYETPLARGVFSLALTTYSAPALDPLRATVDPRLGGAGIVGWSRDRFSTTLSGSTSLSLAHADNDDASFDASQASLVAAYRFSDWVSMDAGWRIAKQQYKNSNTVPFGYAGFVGLLLGYSVPLKGGGH